MDVDFTVHDDHDGQNNVIKGVIIVGAALIMMMVTM